MRIALAILTGIIVAVMALASVLAITSYSATITVSNTSASAYTNPNIMTPQDNTYLATNGFIQADASDVKVRYGSSVLPSMITQKQTWFETNSLSANSTTAFSWTSGNALGTCTNNTGRAVGSPISLMTGANTIDVTTLGTFTIVLDTNVTGTATSGAFALVVGSPVTLTSGGTTSITVNGAIGTITITVTKYQYAMVGNGGFITSLDNPVLEPSNSFLIDRQDYIDTMAGSGKYLVNKSAALTLGVDPVTSGNINLLLNTTQTLQLIQAAVFNVSSTNPTRAGERFTAFPANQVITAIDLYLSKNGAPTGTGTVNVRKSSDDTLLGSLGTIDVSTLTGALAFYTFNGYVDCGAETDIRITFDYNGAGGAVYVNFGYDNANVVANATATYYTGVWTDDGLSDATWQNLTYSTGVRATAVASGIHRVRASLTGGTLSLQIDSLAASTLAFAGSVADNGNNWLLNQNNVSAYMGYYKYTVSGVEKLWYQTKTILAVSTSTYNTGTVTLTTGSSAVTGAGGASFTGNMQGGQIKGNVDGVYYTIQSVNSSTSLTLTQTYNETGGGGLAYTLNYYPTATLVDNDSTQNATITFGTNLTNVYANVNNMSPTSTTAVAVIPQTTYDIANIPYNSGGTVATWTTGTANFTTGSATVTGNDTLWISSMAGGYIKFNADGVYVQILSVTSPTQITLTAVYAPAGGSGAYTMEYLSGGTTSDDILQANNIFTPWWQPWANVSNIPLITFFLFIGTAFLIAAVVLTLKYTQNQLIGGFVMILGEIFLYKMGIYQLWFVIVTGLICIALLIFERKPAL